jgi:uncharacterized protein YndB with AHSA1/START domain
MLKTEHSVVIDAPVEEVFAYATDPEHVPEYYTDVSEVKDLRRLPNGGYAGTFVPLDLPVETIEFVPNERIVLRGNWCGPMDDVTITTTFDRLDSDRTRVTSHEEHTFHGGFFARIGEKSTSKYLDHAAEMTMAALKTRIEAETLAAAAPS